MTIAEAIKRMERYCSYQERCHQEVTKKLREMRMIPEAVDHIIGHLIKENFLNEERFARGFARGKFRIKKWGRNRIVAELKQRQISKFNIKAALSEIDEDIYQKTFDELAAKRLLQLKETNMQRKRKKLADYLFYRGWEKDMVYEKLKSLT